MTLFIAFNYGGRCGDRGCGASGSTAAARRSSERCLYAPDMHDPDVIIRTGAEQRLSNFLLWQAAYAELVFRDELWPNFTREALEESLEELGSRRRRFGGAE